jgi:hypothetical protein
MKKIKNKTKVIPSEWLDHIYAINSFLNGHSFVFDALHPINGSDHSIIYIKIPITKIN